MSQRGSISMLGVAFAAALAAAPALAADEYHFKPFVTATWAAPIDDTEAILGTETAEIDLTDEFGWEAGLEWRFTRLLGVEASYGRSEHEIQFGGDRLGDATFEPIYVALNVHLFAGEAFDFWAAPTVVFAQWDESRLERGVEEGDDSDTGFGVTFGADWMLGETFALTGALRYVDVQIGLGPEGSVAVDPVVVRLGLAARF